VKKQKTSPALAIGRETLKILDRATLGHVGGAFPRETRQSNCDAECRSNAGLC